MKEQKYIFRKTHDIDKDKFAELLITAKGGRTMKDFAELCGANPSTFTRIIQKTNKGSSSTELIEAIAKQAIPQSGVTIEALADANGYVVEKDNGIKAAKLSARGINTEILVRNVLVQELLDRDAEVRMGNIRYNFGKTLALSPDALIMTNAFGKKDEVWFVDSITTTLDINENGTKKFSIKRMAFDRISRFTLISMNKYETFRPTHFSLVVFDTDVYEMLIDEFAETNVPTVISIILIDTINSTIAQEFVLPHFTEGIQDSYFMTTQRVHKDDLKYVNSDVPEDEE